MSDFFEVSPRPPDPPEQRYRQPSWFGPPEGVLPGTVALDRVLGCTERVAVCVGGVRAYPAGFEFEVVTMTSDEEPGIDPLLSGLHAGSGRDASGAIPPEMLRIGLRFADGRKATNVEGSWEPPKPDQLMFSPQGGGGGGGSWRQEYWAWPLPPPGMLSIVCEWPSQGIPETVLELDAQLIVEASKRAQVVFSDEHLPDWPDDEGWASSA